MDFSQPFRKLFAQRIGAIFPLRNRVGRLAAAGCAVTLAVVAPAAMAQVAVEGAVLSDYRVRGYSMSNGGPAASISLSYDDPSGIYLGGAAVASVHDGEPELAALQANAGYALRLSPGLSLDTGVSRSQYYYAYGGLHLHYTELYLGLATPHLATRVSLSPDYLRSGNETLYAEVDGGIEPATDWFLSAHAGLFRYLDAPPYAIPRERYDWRVDATRRFGATGLHLDVSGRIQGSPSARASDDTAVVLSVTHAF
jgi:uncharacterized protein (TIGR02001 family)